MPSSSRGTSGCSFAADKTRWTPTVTPSIRATWPRNSNKLPDDSRLNAHVAVAVARHGRRGWRIDKANRSDKIDAVVALAMALDRIENRPEPAKLIGWL
jgi:hypothetical protein